MEIFKCIETLTEHTSSVTTLYVNTEKALKEKEEEEKINENNKKKGINIIDIIIDKYKIEIHAIYFSSLTHSFLLL